MQFDQMPVFSTRKDLLYGFVLKVVVVALDSQSAHYTKVNWHSQCRQNKGLDVAVTGILNNELVNHHNQNRDFIDFQLCHTTA